LSRTGCVAKQVELHHAEQLWWPERGLRKQDAWDYYAAIASTVLPHLRDRPFTIKQHYNGPRSPYRWLKDKPPEAPVWIPTTEQPAKSRGGQPVRYVLVQDRETLLWLVDFGCVDLHVWTSRIDRPDRPDVVLLDLDPKTATFEAVVETAMLVRQALELLGLDGVPMTTGGKGMHIRIPIARRYTYDQVRAFARIIESTLRRVGGQGVKLDVKMNGHGQQLVAPYSIRPLPSAAVATPLQWEEVNDDLDPTAFTPEFVRERIAQTGDSGAALLRGEQTLPGRLT
jgi:bifunctional non-homologous end joining protein LigD